MSLKLRYSQT